MKHDEELEIADDEDEFDDEDLDDEELDEIERTPAYLGVRGFLAGVLVGAVVGAGFALLLAPDRGEIVRKRISRGWHDFQDEARDQLEDWRGEARRELRKQRRRLKRRMEKGTRR